MSGPSFFILGAGRSGTSILQEVLSLHSRLVVSHELRVLELALIACALFDNAGDPKFDERAPKSAAGLELGREFVALLGEEQLRAAAKLGGVYADKYPPYCEQISLLDQLWPRARFVHILRDGRDVVSSALTAFVTDRGWRRERTTPTVARLTQQWVMQVTTARRYAAQLPRERYFELRYEDLTKDAPRVLLDVLRFVGLDADQHHEEMAKRLRPGKTWRDTLSHAELIEFESVAPASALLRELGYPRTPLAPDDPGADTTQSHWTASIANAARWADAGDAAKARGDERQAQFAYLRAIRDRDKDLRGALGLLAHPKRAESLFAAMNALPANEVAAKEALIAWMNARGLDPEAARAVMGLRGGGA